MKHLQARKSVQEKVYAFLEHPVGWPCFCYHVCVWVALIARIVIFYATMHQNICAAVTFTFDTIVALVLPQTMQQHAKRGTRATNKQTMHFNFSDNLTIRIRHQFAPGTEIQITLYLVFFIVSCCFGRLTNKQWHISILYSTSFRSKGFLFRW